MALDIGRVAFEGYCERTNEPYLRWEMLDQSQQDGWRAGAVAVLRYIDSCKSLPDDVEG